MSPWFARPERHLHLTWLVRLRWTAMGGQLLLLAAVSLAVSFSPPLPWLALVFGAQLGANA
ncbi:MAG: hypothetical protein ACO3JL_01890, partial [Myxococcota bacterium]